jgi:hypothetical protein
MMLHEVINHRAVGLFGIHQTDGLAGLIGQEVFDTLLNVGSECVDLGHRQVARQSL